VSPGALAQAASLSESVLSPEAVALASDLYTCTSSLSCFSCQKSTLDNLCLDRLGEQAAQLNPNSTSTPTPTPDPDVDPNATTSPSSDSLPIQPHPVNPRSRPLAVNVPVACRRANQPHPSTRLGSDRRSKQLSFKAGERCKKDGDKVDGNAGSKMGGGKGTYIGTVANEQAGINPPRVPRTAIILCERPKPDH
jgi:hypothetical protein